MASSTSTAAIILEFTAKGQGGIRIINQAEAALKKTQQAATQANNALISTQASLREMAPAAAAAMAAITAGMVAATRAYANFQTQAVNVQNITEASAAEMNVFRNAIMGMPAELGEATDLMKGLYQTLSSGIPKDNAIEFITANARAARGNLADLTQTVDASTTFLNAYNLETSETTQVLDAMTKTVDLGKVTFAELSANIGKGISIASSANMSYQELLATIATLTLNGLKVEEAMTAVRNILIVALKPTEEVSAAARELGVDLSAAAIQSQGFAQWMGNAAQATQGNAEMVAKLFPSIRALNGAMKLASAEGLAVYNDNLNQITNSSGKVNRNFERMSQTVGAQTQAMVAELKKLGIEFGDIASQTLMPLISGVREMVQAFRDLSPEAKKNIVDFGKIALAVSGVVLVAPKLVTAWISMKTAVTTLSASYAVLTGRTVTTGAASLAASGKISAAAASVDVYAAALAGAVIAGKALEAWFDSMNRLTPQFREGLEDSTRSVIAFAKAAKELGISASELIQQYGGLQQAMDAASSTGHELNSVYERMLLGQKENTELAQEFKKELAERGALSQVIEDYGSLENALHHAAGNLGILGIALQKAKKSLEDNRHLTELNERATKLLADAENRLAAAHQRAAEAAKKAREEHERLVRINEEADQVLKQATRRVIELQDAWIEGIFQAADEWKSSIDSIVQYSEDGWRGATETMLSDYSALQRQIETMPIMMEVVPVGLTDAQQLIGQLQTSGIGNAISGVFNNAIADGMTQGFVDASELAQGFIDDMASYLYDSITTSLKDAFAGAQAGKTEGVGGFIKGLGTDFWLNAGSAVAMGFMARAQQEGDKGEAALTGAISGALQGAKFGWVGAVVGAIVGGVMGYLGASKEETPKTWAQVGYTRQGAWSQNLQTSGNQLFTDEMAQTWQQSQAAIFDAIKGNYRSIVEMFGEPRLLETLSLENLPTFFPNRTEMFEGGAEDLGKWLAQTYWPEQFRDYFGKFLKQGLSKYRVSDESIQALFQELERLPGEYTMDALRDFVTAVVGTSDLLRSLDFDVMSEEAVATARDQINDMFDAVMGRVSTLGAGWDALTGVEQARQIIQMGDLVSQAREAEIEYLRQIYQAQEQITRSIQKQREGLLLGGMNEKEKASYLYGQLTDLFAALQGGGLSTSETMQITGDAQNYINMLQQLLGGNIDRFISTHYSDLPALAESLGISNAGLTGREFLMELLGKLEELSAAALQEEQDESRARIEAYNQALSDANDLLLTFGERLSEILASDWPIPGGLLGGGIGQPGSVGQISELTQAIGSLEETIIGLMGSGFGAGGMASAAAAETIQNEATNQENQNQMYTAFLLALQEMIDRVGAPVIQISGSIQPLIELIETVVLATLNERAGGTA